MWKVYYKAKQLAINNGRTFHLAAVLIRDGRVVKIGENTDKTHPRFKRFYKDGGWAANMHAEMNVLRFAKPGDVVEVMRFSKCSHQLTMAKPCPICMMHMKEVGISEVRYTNWEGKWETIKL